MRRGRVLYQNQLAGWIEEVADGYQFRYAPVYLANPQAKPISVTLPLSDKPYISKTMLPFFDGLIPEGWLMELGIQHWKLDRRDRMGLLLTVCHNCIGAVSIEAELERETPA